MRRDQLFQKRNSSTSSTWVQNLPGLSGPLKRSLWYKMHRRRQQIVLRPTFISLLDDLLKQVESKDTSLKGGVPDESIELKLKKAEQVYLLATHPVAPKGETIPTIPAGSASTPWAEPGMYRCVDVLCLLPNFTLQRVLVVVTFLFSKAGIWSSTSQMLVSETGFFLRRPFNQ